MADRIVPGEGIIGDLAARGAAEFVNDTGADPRPSRSRAPRTCRRAADGRLAGRAGRRQRRAGGLATGRQRPVHPGGPRLPRRPVAAGGDRDRQRPPVRPTARGARGRRAGEPGEEHVPRGDEPRDPDADERDHRDERPARRHDPRRRAARLRRDDPDLRRRAADDHQRHPRLLEDRGRPGRPRPSSRSTLPAHRRGRARPHRARPPRRRASSSPTRSTTTLPVGARRRCRPAPPDRPEPAVERGQVHRARRGRRPRRWPAGSTPARTARRRWELSIDVRDTGIGIPPERWPASSSRSARLDASIARRYGGTGLGLAISRRLAEADGRHAHAPRAPASPARAATFRLHPGRRGGRRRRPSSRARGSQPVELAGRHVLVVDDNATNRRILTAQLARWGMDARETGSPNEALAWVEGGERFDLALLDLLMPEHRRARPGRGVPRRSTRRRAGRSIVLSSVGQRATGRATTIVAFLTKPVKPSAPPRRDLPRSWPERCASRPAAVGRRAAASAGRPARAIRSGSSLAEDNAGEPEARPPPARTDGLRGRRRRRRAGGDRRPRAAAVRRRPHGRPDARARRPRGDAPDPGALARPTGRGSWP